MPTVKEQYDELRDLVDGMNGDIDKVDQSAVRAAGKRCRKSLQEIKKLAQAMRLAIMDEIR